MFSRGSRLRVKWLFGTENAQLLLLRPRRRLEERNERSASIIYRNMALISAVMLVLTRPGPDGKEGNQGGMLLEFPGIPPHPHPVVPPSLVANPYGALTPGTIQPSYSDHNARKPQGASSGKRRRGSPGRCPLPVKTSNLVGGGGGSTMSIQTLMINVIGGN